MTTALDVLWEIIFARVKAARDAVQENGQRFVHYTRAETAVSIIQNRKVWMRNALVMNDFQEIAYGQMAFTHAWNSDQGDKLRSALTLIDSTIVEQFAMQADAVVIGLRHSTFLTSLSEHDPTEDRHGRLSMWRAYGGENGVAIVLKNAPFVAISDALGAYSAPVLYGTPADIVSELARIAEGIATAADTLRSLPVQEWVRLLLQMYRLVLLTTKHPGFREEREWRVVHSPLWNPSSVLEETRVVVGGVYQRVFTIPLVSDPTRGLTSASVPDILDRIILGPTRYPHVAYDAFVRLLLEAGVVDAADRVVVSDIPLRQ